MEDPFNCYSQPLDINKEFSEARDRLVDLIKPFFSELNSTAIILTNYRKGTKLFEHVFSALNSSSDEGFNSNDDISIVSVERIKINGVIRGFILRPTKFGKYNPFGKHSGVFLSFSDIESNRYSLIQHLPLNSSRLVLFLDSVKSGSELNDILNLLSKLDNSAVGNIISIIIYAAVPGVVTEIANKWGLSQDIFHVIKEINHIDCYHVRILQELIGTAYEPWEEVLLPFSGIEPDHFKDIVLDVLNKLYPDGNIDEFENELETNKRFTIWNIKVEIPNPHQSDGISSFILGFRFFENKSGILEKVYMLIENIDAQLNYEPNPFTKKCPLLDPLREKKLKTIGVSPYCNDYLLLTQDSWIIQEAMCVRCLYYNFAKILRYNIENSLIKN